MLSPEQSFFDEFIVNVKLLPFQNSYTYLLIHTSQDSHTF